VLWASTSTKNPAYSDVLYVEDLIGQDTVNTIPPATLDAFRDHGNPRATLTESVEDAHKTMQSVAKLGISMDEVTDKLTDDGVKLLPTPSINCWKQSRRIQNQTQAQKLAASSMRCRIRWQEQ